MASLNRMEVIGNLGADPEQRTVGDGKVVSFSVATTESWTDKRSNDPKERTTWHRISIWNEALAEVAMKYLKKGSQARVVGQVEYRDFTDREGVNHKSAEVVLRPYRGELTLLDRTPKAEPT